MNNEPQEKNEGATPRTDAQEVRHLLDMQPHVHADFARTLERELALSIRDNQAIVDECEELRAQLAARPTAPEPEQQGEGRELLSRFSYWTKGMLQDLPDSRDWFDPDTEINLRELTVEAELYLATPARVDAGRVRELEGALREILADMPIFDCGDFHHAKKDRHDYYPCPVMARFETAIDRARALLTPPVSATPPATP